MNNRTRKKTSANHNEASMSINSQATLGAGAMVSDESQPAAPERPPRIRLNSGQNLNMDMSLLDQENYAYYWFKESAIKGGRIESAKNAYWEMFSHNGNNFQRHSGDDTQHLMQLPIQYALEDRALKRERSLATLTQKTAIGSGEYAPTVDGRPEGGTSAITRSPS